MQHKGGNPREGEEATKHKPRTYLENLSYNSALRETGTEYIQIKEEDPQCKRSTV